jgi:uncharacterized protein YkwD
MGRVRRARRSAPLCVELLEKRELLSGYAPTAVEQEFLERLNDARANPPAYGKSIGLNLAGVPASQPLAFNTDLIQSSRDHSQDMNAHNYFGHNGSDGSNPFQRMQADGFPWVGAAESIAAGYPTPEDALAGLIIDAGVADLGHRKQLLSIGGVPYQGLQQTGVGIVLNGSGIYSNYYTVDSGYTSDTRPFLLGVAFNDLNLNRLYDAGEGLGNVTIIASNRTSRYQTTTWASGGYSIQVNPGTYTVTAEGGGLPVPVTRVVTVGSINCRLNFQPPNGLTTTALSADANPGYAGETITFTATVTNIGNGTSVPQGQVEFFDGTTDLGPGTALAGSGSQATSTFTTAALPAGTHDLKAVFTPLGSYRASQGTLTETITADHLVFTALPANAVAGQPLGPSVQVQVVDQSGNLVATDNSDQVKVSVATGPGPITGDSIITATVSGGIATFDDIVLTAVGSYTFNAVATGGLTGPVSASVTVSPAAPAQLAFVLQPGDEAAGGPVTPPLQVQVLDQFGNLATQDNSDQVSVAVAAGPGTIAGGSTATATASAGVAVFDNLAFTAAGTYLLNASASGLIGAQSESVAVPLFADAFNRPDSNTLGAPWVQVAGTVGLFGNQLTVTGFTESMAVYGSAPLSGTEVQANVTLSSTGFQDIGLVARYSGPGERNFYLGVLASNQGQYTAYLVRNFNGQWKQLASAPVKSGSGILSLQAVGSSLKLFLDGQLLVYAHDSALAAGTTGVWGSPGATVSAFAGGPMTAASATLPFNDNFTLPGGSQLDSFWTELQGNFSVQSDQLRANGNGLNLALLNQAPAADVSVQADITLSSSGSQQAGLIARSSNNGSSMYLGLIAGKNGKFTASIFRELRGVWTRIASAPLGGGTGTLRIEVVGPSLKLFLNGALAVYAFDSRLPSGVTGVRAGGGALLDNFGVAALDPMAAPLPFTDSFAQPDGSQLSRFWTEKTGNFSVIGGQLRANAAGNLAVINQTPVADVVVQAGIALGSSASQAAGLVARYSAAGGGSMYMAQVSETQGHFTAAIWRRVRGTNTRLTVKALTSGTGVLRFVLQGKHLQLYFNGQLVCDVADSSITAAGLTGLNGQSGALFSAFSVSA